LFKEGRRVGFTFVSPTKPDVRMSCFPDPPDTSDQIDLFEAAHGERSLVAPCNSAEHWSIVGGIETATFETITVKPSLDGSAAGLWHGFITNGEIA
jgi:hypothetical protein